MPKTREESLEERRKLREEYGGLFDSLAATLFWHDPFSVNYDAKTDEYEREASTILPRLRNCRSVDDVRQVVYEESVRWFGFGTLGMEESVASEIWQLWEKFKAV